MINTHSPDKCSGEHCVVHNPSDHHMKDWPLSYRLDRSFALAERRCPHGIGHPDPDSLAHIARVAGRERADTESVHGCDFCCSTGS